MLLQAKMCNLNPQPGGFLESVLAIKLITELYMITETSGKTELLTAIDEAVSELQDLMLNLDENKINTVPYKDSWTAGQLFRHVTKSTNGMARVMLMESKPAERDPGEKIPELRKAFLDFSHKLKSPDFIVPEEGPYEKQAAIEELSNSFERLKENTSKANLTEMTENLPLGAITKLEMLHFVLYHTQRHLHQMKKICDALKNK
jgi:DinB superfamily